jgi:hypothetical protein
MDSPLPYVEENFGILTDDDLYIDCILVKPVGATDTDIRVMRVWVPKYPLTKSSVITCARQDVASYGTDRRIAHLVFDLRGTGDSEGIQGDQSYELDLVAIKDWADERFGAINFGFLGYPSIEEFAKVNVWPLRAGAVMESYFYRATSASVSSSTILYMATYGSFSRRDEALCVALSEAGYDVYGIDPLRYLLHANQQGRLGPDALVSDMRELIRMLPDMPMLIGQPLSSGLALMWGIGVQRVRGVIAIGPAQAGLRPKHIFANDNPLTFQLSRYIDRLAPRPVSVVFDRSRRKASAEKEMLMLHDCADSPRRLERVDKVTPELLIELARWVDGNQP